MFFRKKAAFFGLERWEQDLIRKNLRGYNIRFFDKSLSEENVAKIADVEILGIFIYSKITPTILDRLPRLRIITTLSTGFDHIDIEECKRRKITVCNVPIYGENTVAEHTFALILALSRKVFQSIERTKKGDFDYEGLTGFDLKGKTLGVVGTGHISAHVVRIAYGFEMKILGYDLNQNPELVDRYGLKYVSLDDLIRQSDIISLHLPLNDKTRHIMDKKRISLMKPSALIINTARGGLIDTDALVYSLQKGKIAGAGLDVLEEENDIKEERQLISSESDQAHNLQILLANHILFRMDNVVVTPHNAFNSVEALRRIIDTSIQNIKDFYKGDVNNKIV